MQRVLEGMYKLIGEVIRQAIIDYLRYYALQQGYLTLKTLEKEMEVIYWGKDARYFLFMGKNLETFLHQFSIDKVVQARAIRERVNKLKEKVKELEALLEGVN